MSTLRRGVLSEKKSKLVNVIKFKPYIRYLSKASFLCADMEPTYPVTSDISLIIELSDNVVIGELIIPEGSTGQTYTDMWIDPTDTTLSVISYSPAEDDTYIYEFITEYE